MNGADQHDDLLRRATAALRDETGAEHPRPSATRARLLESAARQSMSTRSTGRRWLRWLFGVGSVFVVGTALARVPEYGPLLLAALRPAADAGEAAARRVRSAPAKKKTKQVKPAPSRLALDAAGTKATTPELSEVDPAAAVAAPADLVIATSPEPGSLGTLGTVAAAGVQPVPPVESSRTAHASRPSLKAHAPQPASSSGRAATPWDHAAHAPVTDESSPRVASETAPSAPPIAAAELELFRRAERLHRAADPRALEAWDAYLRLAEHGVLVPEARYNRALCLMRLGRKLEAKAALTPFARGVYGSYRRQEAESLLEALRSSF